MAGVTTTPSGPTCIVESYHAVEDRITQAIEILQVRGGQPNLAAVAREFFLPAHHLRASWNSRPSNIQAIPGNGRLSKHQESAVYQYLDRLYDIGLPAHLFVITDYGNAILRHSHQADSDALRHK